VPYGIRGDTARVKVKNAECPYLALSRFYVDAEYKGWTLRVPAEAFAHLERGIFENIDSLDRTVFIIKNGKLAPALAAQKCDTCALAVVDADSAGRAIATARTPLQRRQTEKGLAAAAGLNLGPDVSLKTRYDRLEDFTSVDAPALELTEEVKIQPTFICSGNRASCRPSTVTLQFSRSGKDWEFLRYHPILFLLDGKTRMRLGDEGYDGRVGDGYVLEFQTVSLSLPQFLQITRANRVEGSWGLYEFELGSAQLASLKALANAIHSR
jgi:hypothetical protein